MALTEPTPTLEEFIYSWTPSGFVPTDLEGWLYFDIKVAILVAPTMVQTAWIMATTGVSFQTAAYMATDTKAWWWALKKMQTYGKFARSPALVVGAAGLYAHQHTMSSPPPTVALRSEPGQASWWRAVAQSIGAGGFGVGTGIRL
jgi:hypothetical protein